MTVIVGLGFFAVTMSLSAIYLALRRIIVEQQFANHLMHTETVRRRQLNEIAQQSKKLLDSYAEKEKWTKNQNGGKC